MLFEKTGPYLLHPPRNLKLRSAWVFFHDAHLELLRFNPRSGNARMTLRSTHISEHYGLAPETSYQLDFININFLSALTTRSKRNAPAPRDVKGADDKRREWFSRVRIQSMGWNAFERRIANDDDAETYDGDFITSPEVTSFQILVSTGGGNEWHQAYISSQSVACARSDGWEGSFDQLVAMGGAYWEAFGNGE